MVSHVFSQNDSSEYLKDYRPTPGFHLHIVFLFLFFREELMAFWVFTWYLQKKGTYLSLLQILERWQKRWFLHTVLWGQFHHSINRGNEVSITSSVWFLKLQPVFHQSAIGFNNTNTFSLLLTGLRPATNFTYRSVIWQLLSPIIFQSLLCRIIFINK